MCHIKIDKKYDTWTAGNSGNILYQHKIKKKKKTERSWSLVGKSRRPHDFVLCVLLSSPIQAHPSPARGCEGQATSPTSPTFPTFPCQLASWGSGRQWGELGRPRNGEDSCFPAPPSHWGMTGSSRQLELQLLAPVPSPHRGPQPSPGPRRGQHPPPASPQPLGSCRPAPPAPGGPA